MRDESGHTGDLTAGLVFSKGEGGHWDDQPILTADNQTTFAVHSLLPFTAYSFRVTAVNGVGASPPGEASYHIITLREGELSPAGIVSIAVLTPHC